MQSLKPYLAASVMLLILDVPWITYFGRGFYQDAVYTVQRSPINLRVGGAIGAYLLLVIGLVQFVVNQAQSASDAALRGALFGLVVYGVYDFTSYAVLNGWNLMISLIDIVWGTLLCALVSTVVYVYTWSRLWS